MIAITPGVKAQVVAATINAVFGRLVVVVASEVSR